MTKNNASILIVEDEATLCTLLSHLLSPNFDCVTVLSADDALPLIESRAFDVVLVDIELPGMSGIEFCQKVIERSPSTAVIILSGRAVTEMTIEAIRAGAFDYITKPFDLSRIKETVERAINRRTEGGPKKGVSASNERSNG